MKNNRFLMLPEEPTTVISHKFTGSASKVSGSVDKSRRIAEEARLEKTCMEESPNRPGGLFFACPKGRFLHFGLSVQ